MRLHQPAASHVWLREGVQMVMAGKNRTCSQCCFCRRISFATISVATQTFISKYVSPHINFDTLQFSGPGYVRYESNLCNTTILFNAIFAFRTAGDPECNLSSQQRVSILRFFPDMCSRVLRAESLWELR